MSIHNKAAGEEAWPPLMMFKALLLQSWCKLSVPQLEKAIGTRFTVLSFCWPRLRPTVPDHNTLWRFRQKLANGVWDTLLQEINDQLSHQQLYIKRVKSASSMPVSFRRNRITRIKV